MGLLDHHRKQDSKLLADPNDREPFLLSDHEALSALMVACQGVFMGLDTISRWPQQSDHSADHSEVFDEGPPTAQQATKSTAKLALRRVKRTVVGEVFPGHPTWRQWTPPQRIDWWIDMLDDAVATAASLPSISGKLGPLPHLGEVLAASGQLVAICAVAYEQGVTDSERVARTSAEIILGRQLGALDQSNIRRVASGENPPIKLEGIGLPARLLALGKLVAGGAQTIERLIDELQNRPRGGRFSLAMSKVPGISLVATYGAEKQGVQEAAARAMAVFRHEL